ncbi:hypothetical protein [Streptomyces sp. NBC_00076]|uniref:hypothetical protein n=1 Tax=Streptomyces sp. NBC_00076 TaxID=2975642 RepID=UPI003248A915
MRDSLGRPRLPPPTEVSEEEIEGALALIESMTRDDLEGPEFADAMAKIIQAKREDCELPEVPEPEKPGEVLDLMAALTESVNKAKAFRGEDTEGAVRELPKKKARAKKATAKKSTKKTSGHRPRSA